MPRPACCISLVLFICCVEANVFSRVKRQSAVGTNAETNGNGDQVLTDASTLHWKTADGSLGMNVTANGNATGAGSANVINSAGGNVGNATVENAANVLSVGDQSSSFSDIFAAVEGENMTMKLMQQGKSGGLGAVLSTVNGGGSMQNNSGQKQSGFSFGNAGGTGSINSQAEIETNQAMSWDQLMARLMGTATASGYGSAQANVDLGSGTNNNNMTISGLVSGLNSGNGTVNAMVSGNGTLNGNTQNVQGMMVGSASGKGNSTLVAASAINSNQSSSSEMQAFGNANAYSSGNSTINLLSNTNVGTDNGLGVVHIRGSAQGANNQIYSSNGLKLTDAEQDAAFIGSGVVKSFGSDNSSGADQNVDTAVDSNGVVKIISKGEGKAISNDGTNSSLSFSANGMSGGWNNSSSSANAIGTGSATGDKNTVLGGGFIDINGNTMNGNASMTAYGRGQGQSSADSQAVLKFNENGETKNGTISGSAIASGNETNVQSLSMISSDQALSSNLRKAIPTPRQPRQQGVPRLGDAPEPTTPVSSVSNRSFTAVPTQAKEEQMDHGTSRASALNQMDGPRGPRRIGTPQQHHPETGHTTPQINRST